MQTKKPHRVIGSLEPVVFPEFNNLEIVAKIDTGAYTGALHCTKIRIEETPEGGLLLKFSPFDHPELEITETEFAVRHVRSSNGTDQHRYFINTHIAINGVEYPIVLSLANRSEMRSPVLIGRKFLRRDNFVVDVSRRAAYRERKD